MDPRAVDQVGEKEGADVHLATDDARGPLHSHPAACRGVHSRNDVGTAPLVEAAIFSKGRVTVFAKAEKYEYAMLCIKDWITQVNSMHRDRFDQPKNVQLVRAK